MDRINYIKRRYQDMVLKMMNLITTVVLIAATIANVTGQRMVRTVVTMYFVLHQLSRLRNCLLSLQCQMPTCVLLDTEKASDAGSHKSSRQSNSCDTSSGSSCCKNIPIGNVDGGGEQLTFISRIVRQDHCAQWTTCGLYKS